MTTKYIKNRWLKTLYDKIAIKYKDKWIIYKLDLKKDNKIIKLKCGKDCPVGIQKDINCVITKDCLDLSK